MRIIYTTILLLISLSIIGQKQAKIKYNYSAYKSKEVKKNGKIEIKKISNDIENALNENLNERQKRVLEIYRNLNAKNQHKMNPIPVCEIPDVMRS